MDLPLVFVPIFLTAVKPLSSSNEKLVRRYSMIRGVGGDGVRAEFRFGMDVEWEALSARGAFAGSMP